MKKAISLRVFFSRTEVQEGGGGISGTKCKDVGPEVGDSVVRWIG